MEPRNDWSVIREAREADDRSVSFRENPTSWGINYGCVGLAAILALVLVVALFSFCGVEVPR